MMSDQTASHQWVSEFSARTDADIVHLIDCAVADGGTLGYAAPLSPREAATLLMDLRQGVSSGRTHVLLGRVGKSPAFLGVLTISPMANCRHRAELTKGVVHPELRGRRFVQLALREVVLLAERLGVEQLVLDVREGSRAHSLWGQFGFESYGVLADYARIDGVSHRGHYMAQSVASLRKRLMGTSRSQEFTTQKEEIYAQDEP